MNNLLSKVPKGHHLKVHVVPFMYWVTTRMIGGYYSTVVHRFGWQVIAIFVLGGGLEAVVAFFISWVCFKPLYEIGYLVNDYYSEPREVKTRPRPKLHTGLSTRQWLLLLATRVLFSLLIASLLCFLVPRPEQALLSYAIIFFSLICFALHNLIGVNWRPITYFFLHLAKGALVIPFVPISHMDFSLWACIVIPAISTTAYYLGHKEVSIFIPCRAYLGHLVWQLRMSSTLLFLCFIGIWLAGGNQNIFLKSILGYYLIFDGLTSYVTFMKAARRSRSRRDFIQHVHSEYSHDSVIKTDKTPQYAKEAGFQVCFMTEHAEDFTAVRYEEYKNHIYDANNRNTGSTLIPGLEFSVLKQHILACNLKEFLEVDSKHVNSIDQIRRKCDKVVWAHPMVSVRRLFDPKYVVELFRIAKRVDGVEWASGKFDRPDKYFARRHLVVAFIMHVYWPQKEMYFGYDVHNTQDWVRIINAGA